MEQTDKITRVAIHEGWLHLKGFGLNRAVFLYDVPLDPQISIGVRNHSPDGFNWGYSGSGCAQLALAILLECYSPELAIDLHQRFKEAFIAQIKEQNFNVKVNLNGFYLTTIPAAQNKPPVHFQELMQFKAINSYFSWWANFVSTTYSYAEFSKETFQYDVLFAMTHKQIEELNKYLKIHTSHKNKQGIDVSTSVEYSEIIDCFIVQNGMGEGISSGTLKP